MRSPTLVLLQIDDVLMRFFTFAGQVIVIGATNRPDSVDPALRRPGRFDREFYFPLPNKEARKKIISINTRKWQPPLEDVFLDELAGVTKGYGGADLRVSHQPGLYRLEEAAQTLQLLGTMHGSRFERHTKAISSSIQDERPTTARSHVHPRASSRLYGFGEK